MQSEALSKAFIDQAIAHLQEDFMPKIRRCLELLTEEEFWRRGSESENSVGNLILHLSGNVRQWIISGLGGAPDRRERPKEFAARASIPRDEAAALLEQTVSEAAAVLRGMTCEELLRERPIQRYRRTGLEAVFHVVEHFSYHTGQIVFAAKLYTHADTKFYNL